MLFIKNFNNNAALVKDDNDIEWIVVGSGVSFGKRSGDLVDESKVERRFKAEDTDKPALTTFKSLQGLSLEATSKAVNLVEKELLLKFNDFQYLALADHIDFALTRIQNGIDLNDGTVRWEVRKLFKKEFAVAQEVVNLINGVTGAALPDSEVILMTYHLVNAESDGSKLQDTIKITRLIAGIIDIVQYQYRLVLDVDSFNYTRFVGHLRAFMVQRLSNSNPNGGELDPSLLMLMQQKYPKAYETVERIDTFLQNKAGWRLHPDDEVYLTLHIWRVTHRQTED
ncbi:PRD domain-containing protein [Ligilactobacillus sp. WILCCON 0076]|uniref:PRD domain-containing protein n=1 Tax=Ligilactobacillus ubinensis TaxID=2876789 RepID=A0A9X2FKP6_9LACO|nr:PRD domain-containing protein [Ligilactobacillus ubinensis]MCP0886298.1 PRD domain-containing protein [Ligilactobacillus ubinensis]